MIVKDGRCQHDRVEAGQWLVCSLEAGHEGDHHWDHPPKKGKRPKAICPGCGKKRTVLLPPGGEGRVIRFYHHRDKGEVCEGVHHIGSADQILPESEW